MNGQTRKRLYIDISKRDGEYCKCCGALGSERQLVVDHRDNNNYNNSLDNLQLLCRTCNYIKNPRRPFDLCVITDKSSTSLKISRSKEPEFRKYIYDKLDENGGREKDVGLGKRTLINGGAETVGISPVTAKRYLDKMCSIAGDLKCDKGFWIMYKQPTDITI